MNLKNIYLVYATGGFKSLIWYFLQVARVSLFWTKEMKHKNTNRFGWWIGGKILALQNMDFFKPTLCEPSLIKK